MTVPMTRKAFCTRLAGGSVLLLIQACGGGGGDVPYAAPAPAPGMGGAGAGCTDTIAANHGHVLTLPIADLDSPVDKTYDIHGSAAHTHTLTLTVANLRTLKAGTNVTVVSSTTAAHEHSVAILCT